MKKSLIIYALIAFAFNVGAQDNTLSQKQYKDGISEQASTYPIKIDDNNIIRRSFIDGDTHVIEIQVNHRTKEYIGKEELLNIEEQLLDTIGVNFCKDGTNESVARTVGISVEYRYFDKNAEPFHSVLFSQKKCNQLAMTYTPERITEEVSVEMKIRALEKAGTGRVKVCELKPLNDVIKIGYSNEADEVATFYVSDEYMVNSFMMNLNKKKLQELRQLLLNADKTAIENAMLDNLNLGEFNSNSGKLLLSSHKGALKGYFRSRKGRGSVRVLLDATEIARCLSQVEPHL
ncbi:MAG: hypothetical protein ACI8UG_000607 [Gammaproteobacteria bacterium]